MRRAAQALDRAACLAILDAATSGVLALLDDDNYPYAVPLSHARDGERLLFHSAVSGHKIAAIRHHPYASFCVIARDEVMPATFSTRYRSVIVSGRVRILEDAAEKRAAIVRLTERFAPRDVAAMEREIEATWDRFCVFELALDTLSGKQARELLSLD